MVLLDPPYPRHLRFSALQRAEIAEIGSDALHIGLYGTSFSALQRAEIAEIESALVENRFLLKVSVLFNEPKLLKSPFAGVVISSSYLVSVLFNEPKLLKCDFCEEGFCGA